MSDVTMILKAIENGDSKSTDKLLPLVYEELRRLAAVKMTHERSDHTLQATALVNEAYLRLVGSNQPLQWDGKNHFFAAAAEAMRRILVENARQKKRIKHGGEFQRVDLLDDELANEVSNDQMLSLDTALEILERENPQRADLVKLKYFAGLPIEQVAETLGISRSTAIRQWTFARAWLYEQIQR